MNSKKIMIKNLHRYFFSFIVIFSSVAMCQSLDFQRINSCVDFNPGGNKGDCRTEKVQVNYNASDHYFIRGIYGIATPFTKFQEICQIPRKSTGLFQKIGNYKHYSDFVCYSEKEKWLLFVDFDKWHKNLISAREINYFTCSSLDYSDLISKFENKIGKYWTPIMYGNESNFLYRLKMGREKQEPIYRYKSKSESVQAFYNFDSSIHPFLQCPGGIILEIEIKVNPELIRAAEKDFEYRLNKPTR